MKKTNRISSKIGPTESAIEQSAEGAWEELSEDLDKTQKDWLGVLDWLSFGLITKRQNNIQLEIWKNRLKILNEANWLVIKSGHPVSKIDLRLQHEFFENTGLETNQTLQQKWANLLANAATKKVDVNVKYTKILAELSELDVFILDTLFEKQQNMSIRDFENKAGLDELKVVLDGLFANQLIKSPFEDPDRVLLAAETSGEPYEFEVEGKTYSDFSPTPLGSAFVQACKFDL